MNSSFPALRKNLALFCLLAASSAAQATPLFSNFSAGHGYDTSAGLAVGDGNLDGSANYAQASAFTAGATATLGSIVIALSDVFGAGQPAPVTVALRSNSGGTPGGVLESFTIAAGTIGTLGLNNATLVLNSITHPSLNNGTQYWVAVSTSLTNLISWNFNNSNDLTDGVEAQSLDGGGSWAAAFGNTRGAFEVDPYVPAVPEPGTPALLAGGLAAWLGRRRRFSRKA